MTQEDKNLLLKDLCARLPYHPIVYVDENLPRLKLGIGTRVWEYTAVDKPCKPYLRSMSSMTDEEYIDYRNIDNRSYSCPMDYAHIPASDRIDWLNKHHFDFRNLIERGLAIAVTEENNPYK